MRSWDWWTSPGTATWSIFIRLSLAGVFVFEGLQKLTHAESLGAGRFAKIGIPAPEVFGPLVGCVELAAGVLFLIGYASRVAAVPIIVIMIVAILSTKIPISARARMVRVQPARTGPLRLPELHARNPHRLGDADGCDLPVVVWFGPLVTRRTSAFRRSSAAVTSLLLRTVR